MAIDNLLIDRDDVERGGGIVGGTLKELPAVIVGEIDV
jgi:hypothetical protein